MCDLEQKIVFEVSGKYLEKKEWKSFTRNVLAVNETFATETVLSLLGSEHKAKRRNIQIVEVKKAEDKK